MTSPPMVLPPALLTDASWYGTLAATRDLGAHGVPVTLAADSFIAPARWSRHVTSIVPAPIVSEAGRFVEWLHAFGRRAPGYVLYPTSDDAAWLISAHKESLSTLFRLYSPPLKAYVSLLDKVRLTAAAQAAGLEVPPTWCPQDEAEVERIGREACFPLWVKPRIQVLARSGAKGTRVNRREDLLAAWQGLRRRTMSDPELAKRVEGYDLPILQACQTTTETIYTVDAFISRSGEMTALACTKLLQRPRRSGHGVCFEESALDSAIAEKIRRVCVDAGFYGVVDVEFVMNGDRRLLIDLNPRFYNHMAFEVDRGLPMAWLAYLGALGRDAEVDAGLRRAAALEQPGGRVYVHRLPMTMMLLLQRLTGAMSTEEQAHWWRWMRDHATHLTDPAIQDGDRVPGLGDLAYHMLSFARHPRSFLRGLAFDSGTHRGVTAAEPSVRRVA